MLVFGGFSANKLQRYFNDLWLYDVATESWKQPPQAETVPDPAGLALPALKRPWQGVPEPRGAHASTLVKLPNNGGLRLMVFGGYGGAGFSYKSRVWRRKGPSLERRPSQESEARGTPGVNGEIRPFENRHL
jgi:hypothetical protein